MLPDAFSPRRASRLSEAKTWLAPNRLILATAGQSLRLWRVRQGFQSRHQNRNNKKTLKSKIRNIRRRPTPEAQTSFREFCEFCALGCSLWSKRTTKVIWKGMPQGRFRISGGRS